jgi:hypothetical protein
VPGVIRGIRSKPGGPSWTTLVAEAAGLGQLAEVELEVKGTVDAGKQYRLIAHQVPRAGSARRPIASAQLAVSASSIAQGVVLRLYSTDPASSADTQVHAWIEQGPAALEYDGLRAKPESAEFAGSCKVEGGKASALLKRVLPTAANDTAPADAA